jgi:hypothetical protein
LRGYNYFDLSGQTPEAALLRVKDIAEQFYSLIEAMEIIDMSPEKLGDNLSTENGVSKYIQNFITDYETWGRKNFTDMLEMFGAFDYYDAAFSDIIRIVETFNRAASGGKDWMLKQGTDNFLQYDVKKIENDGYSQEILTDYVDLIFHFANRHQEQTGRDMREIDRHFSRMK